MGYEDRNKPNSAELKEWAAHPCTSAFVEWLQQAQADTKDAWAQEQFVGATSEATAIANATALGGLRVLDQVIAKVDELLQGEGL